jgi:hypothetical protein
MPDLLLFTCGREAIIDSLTNRLSIINILETVPATQLPALLADAVAVSLWRRLDNEVQASFQQRVVLVDPENRTVAEIDTSFAFERTGARVLIRLFGILLQSAGVYEYRLFVAPEGSEFPAEPVSRFPMMVQQAPAAQTEAVRAPTQTEPGQT